MRGCGGARGRSFPWECWSGQPRRDAREQDSRADEGAADDDGQSGRVADCGQEAKDVKAEAKAGEKQAKQEAKEGDKKEKKEKKV